MKNLTGKKVFTIILAALILLTVGTMAHAQDKTQVNGQPAPKKADAFAGAYYWREFNPDNATMNYYYVPFGKGDFDGRLDYINLPQANKNVARIRLHYGKLFIANSKGANIYFQPGGMIDDQGKVFYGGQVIAKFPGLGLSVIQKSYGGNKQDYNQTFVDLKLYKPLYVMYYQYNQNKVEPTCAIGPMVKLGTHGYIFYGFPTNKRNTSVINGGVTFRF